MFRIPLRGVHSRLTKFNQYNLYLLPQVQVKNNVSYRRSFSKNGYVEPNNFFDYYKICNAEMGVIAQTHTVSQCAL